MLLAAAAYMACYLYYVSMELTCNYQAMSLSESISKLGGIFHSHVHELGIGTEPTVWYMIFHLTIYSRR